MLHHHSVDMNKYSGLATVPWYEAVIEQGDCLYLPYGWIHQVIIALVTVEYQFRLIFRLLQLVRGIWE